MHHAGFANSTPATCFGGSENKHQAPNISSMLHMQLADRTKERLMGPLTHLGTFLCGVKGDVRHDSQLILFLAFSGLEVQCSRSTMRSLLLILCPEHCQLPELI